VARAGAVSRCGPVNARLTPRWRPVKAPSAAAAHEGAAAEPAAALLYTYTGGRREIERESRHKRRGGITHSIPDFRSVCAGGPLERCSVSRADVDVALAA
jgi:hypothetical protein